MDEKTIAERLFQELGPVLEPASIIYDAEAAQWAVVLEDGVQIDVGHDAESGLLVFALGLGGVPDSSAEQVHEMLLRFSFVWRETGGLHAALDADGKGVLMFKHPLEDLDLQRLQSLIQNLAAHRSLWAELIANSEKEGSAPDIENSAPFGGVRV